MASNLKGGNVVVRLLLGHGEKLWMAGIVVCAALLIWSAIGRERLPENKSPDNLKSLISRANTHIEQFRWEGASPDNVVVATPVNSESMKPVPHEHFPAFSKKFDTPVLAPVQQRTDPELLAAIDLRAYGDSGILATSTPESRRAKELALAGEAERQAKEKANAGKRRGDDLFANQKPSVATNVVSGKGGVIIERPSGGDQLQGYEDTKAVSWITIVAKIPIKDQNLRYQNALASARGYNSRFDAPRYAGYYVKRAEVTSAGEGEWIRIAKVGAKTIEKEQQNKLSRSASLINRKYSHPLLTFPLPSLLLRAWDNRITHPDIPLLVDETLVDPNNVLETVEKEEEAPAGEDDPFGSSAPVRARRGNPRAKQPFPRQAPSYGGDEGYGQGGGYSQSKGGAGGYAAPQAGGYAAPQGGGTGAGNTGLATYVWDQKTEFLLFRYIDRNVEPGKQYRYKIQLALYDVNDQVDEANLDKTVIDRRAAKKTTLRFSPESEPSPIVSVPLPARVYLASMKKVVKDNDYYSEPEVELLIRSYEGDIAAETARLDSAKRGRVVNIRGAAEVIWSNKFSPEEKAEFNFFTGITLLDASGGRKLGRKKAGLTVPVRAVLMDAAGRMFIKSQIEDFEPVAGYKAILEGGASSNRAAPKSEGYGDPGARGNDAGYQQRNVRPRRGR